MEFFIVKRTSPQLLEEMRRHYSAPKGFVGRNICYAIIEGGHCYGHIVAGSATRFLPGRDDFLRCKAIKKLNKIANNIFYHIEPKDGEYPMRNFATKVLELFEKQIVGDWKKKYGDSLIALETLIELPRTGECYRRAGWTKVGQTKGFTCKRAAGKGTDNWTGKRVWHTKNLRPKLVFIKKVNQLLNSSSSQGKSGAA